MSRRTATKALVAAIRRPLDALRLLSVQKSDGATSLESALSAGGEWLLLAQRHSTDGDGYSRKFSLIGGWDKGYTETTGYIVPTLLDLAQYKDDQRFHDSAILAGRWLLSKQLESGAFCDIDNGQPQVFDTGQVLLGLNRLARETGEDQYLDAARRAGNWLVGIQDTDGAWRRHAFNGRPHSYYTRVAAALLETSVLTCSGTMREAAIRNLTWALSQERPNGYYDWCEFRPDEYALLHTIVYVLEGFSLANDIEPQKCWADAVVRGARTLCRLTDDQGILASQYKEDWSPANREVCVTGLAQFAGICFDASRLGSDVEYSTFGRRALNHLMTWQIRSGRNTIGGHPSSIPAWGYYGGMELFNWNTKFFLDAALKAA